MSLCRVLLCYFGLAFCAGLVGPVRGPVFVLARHGVIAAGPSIFFECRLILVVLLVLDFAVSDRSLALTSAAGVFRVRSERKGFAQVGCLAMVADRV